MAKFASLDSLRAIRDWAKEKFQSKLPEVTATDNGKVLSVVEGQWEPTELQGELPEVTSADNGKVLAVVAGEWEKAEAPDGLPPVQSADNGKVLTVIEGEWAKADVPDELPAVSASDNGKVLSVVQGEWAKATPEDELPEVSASDNGKFLGVVNGAWGKAEVNALPAVTSQDNGKVLGVVEGQWAKTEPEDGLPEVTSSDNGKVLSVVEGAWAPAEPSGGSGLPEVTSEDNGDLLSVVNGAWAKSEPGYRVENSETVIAPSQSVTTVEASGVNRGYTQDYTELTMDTAPETLRVTWNGTEYTVPLYDFGDPAYGEFDGGGDPVFTTYPFSLVFFPKADFGLKIQTPEAGTYTIAISEQSTTVTLDDDFKLAVNSSYMETSEVDVVPEQTVEAADQGGFVVADLTNSVLPSPPPETLSVTLNGTVYEVSYREQGGGVMYGDPSLQSVPFAIAFGGTVQMLVPEAGSYAVHASYEVESANPKFQEAVAQTAAPFVVTYIFVLDGGSTPPAVQQFSCDKTYEQIEDAINSGRTVIVYLDQMGGRLPLPMQWVGLNADNGFRFASISPFYDSTAGSLTLYSVSIEHTPDDDYTYYSGSVAATDVEVYHKPS